MLPTEVTTGELARLLGVTRRNFPELAERKIIVPGSRKGTYALEPSVSGYAKHLRRLAQRRHGTEEAIVSATVERAKLAGAHTDLAAEKVKAMGGDTLPTAEVEALWRGKLRAFRNRILAVPHRVPYLSARQTVVLTQELRDRLTELADNEKGVAS